MRHGYDQITLIGDGLFTIGVPDDAPLAFKQYQFAAAKAYILGERTEDILSEFGHRWTAFDNRSKEQVLMEKTSDYVRKEVSRLRTRLPKDTGTMKCTGQYVGCAALHRLTITYELILLALKLGYWIEASSLVKQVIEQVSWVYAIRGMSYDELQICIPSKCVSEWKKVYPSAGQLYGMLNESAHVHPKKTHGYIIAEDDESGILLSSLRETLALTWPVLLTTDMIGICQELCFADAMAEFQFTSRRGGVRSPKKGRKNFTKISRYYTRLKAAVERMTGRPSLGAPSGFDRHSIAPKAHGRAERKTSGLDS